MSRHVVISISEQDTKKPQISLPVSNENIVHLDRRLRSDKPDVHYYITLLQVRRPYNLYCVGGDVKPCSINQSTLLQVPFHHGFLG